MEQVLTTRTLLEQQAVRVWPTALTSRQMVEGPDFKTITEESGSVFWFGHQRSFSPCKSHSGAIT